LARITWNSSSAEFAGRYEPQDGNRPCSDVGGPGAVEALRRAVEDFGGKMLGKPIEVVGSA
jgi:hypothetical protein